MKTHKILIVDSDINNRNILKKILIKDYIIEEASYGKDAIDILSGRYEKFSAIILDLEIKLLTGERVIKVLNEFKITKNIPVIVTSKNNDNEKIINAFNNGAADYFVNPLNEQIIKRRLSNLIELYESRIAVEKELFQKSIELQVSKDLISQNNEFLINALGSVVEFRSNESGNHIKRVKTITKVLMLSLIENYPEYKIDNEDIELITQASALHDVGKIAIPDNILNKAGKLTKEEFEIMKKHTIYGCEILENFKQENSKFYKYCYNICRWHHEKYDGNGYPDELKADEIPIYCQIVAIADCFDALVSKRIYKEEYNIDTAYKMILNNECGVFNLKILNCFKKVKHELNDLLNSNLYE